MPDRLYRSRRDRMIGGVAGGVAEAVRIDPTIVRVSWVLLAFATHGAAALVYFVLLFLVPETPEDTNASAGTSGPTGTTAAGGTSPASARSPSVSRPGPSGRPADGRTRAIVAGAILVLVGGYFLVRQWLPSIDLGVSWPIVAVGLGVILIVASLRAGGRSG